MMVEIKTVVTYSGYGLTRSGHKITFWAAGNILYLDWGDGYKGVYIYQNHQLVLVRSMHFIEYKILPP